MGISTMDFRNTVLSLNILFIITNSAQGCSCPSTGYWSAWVNIGACQPSWVYFEGKDSVTMTQERTRFNITCGMYGRQIQRRRCVSAVRGCPCDGDSLREAPCGGSAPCSLPDAPGITCRDGYRKVGQTCDQITTPPPDPPVVNDPYENDPACEVNPVCPCPTAGAWSDWRDAGACPTIPNYYTNVTSNTISTQAACGSCQTKLQQRTCVSLARGCPCVGLTYRWIRCNPTICSFPIQTCCNDTNEGVKKQLNTENRLYECLPTPKNLWNDKTTSKDLFSANNCTTTTTSTSTTTAAATTTTTTTTTDTTSTTTTSSTITESATTVTIATTTEDVTTTPLTTVTDISTTMTPTTESSSTSTTTTSTSPSTTTTTVTTPTTTTALTTTSTKKTTTKPTTKPPKTTRTKTTKTKTTKTKTTKPPKTTTTKTTKRPKTTTTKTKPTKKTTTKKTTVKTTTKPTTKPTTPKTTKPPLPPCECTDPARGPPFKKVVDGVTGTCAATRFTWGCYSLNGNPFLVLQFKMHDQTGKVIYTSPKYCAGDWLKHLDTCTCRTSLTPGAKVNAPHCQGVKAPYYSCTSFGYDLIKCAKFG